MSMGCGAELEAAIPWWGRRSSASVREEEEEASWAGWTKRPIRSVGLLGQLGRKLKKSFWNKN
jgi:hypothetical protein